MDGHRLLDLVKRRVWVIVAACLLGGISGLFVSLTQHKSYQASTTLYIHSPNHSDYTTLLGDQQAAKAFANFPQAGNVLADAALGIGDKSLSVTQLSSMVSVINVRDTQFVTINVRATDPVEAARLASAVAKQSIAQFQTMNSDSSARRFANDEMATLEGQIRGLEKALAQAGGEASLDAQSSNVASRIKDLSKALDTDRTLYNQLVNSATTMNPPEVSVVQGVKVPSSPVGVGQARGRILAVFMGILAALVAIMSVLLMLESPRDGDIIPPGRARISRFESPYNPVEASR